MEYFYSFEAEKIAKNVFILSSSLEPFVSLRGERRGFWKYTTPYTLLLSLAVLLCIFCIYVYCIHTLLYSVSFSIIISI